MNQRTFRQRMSDLERSQEKVLLKVDRLALKIDGLRSKADRLEGRIGQIERELRMSGVRV